MYLTHERAREMYHNDPEFRHLVSVLRESMSRLQFTPSEMRAAVTFAAVQAEMERPPEIVLSRENLRQIVPGMIIESHREKDV